MQLINAQASLVVSQIETWQSNARAALLTFVTDKQLIRKVGIASFVRELRELRVQTSHAIAPMDADDLRAVVDSLVTSAEAAAGAEIDGDDLVDFADAYELGLESTLATLRDALRMDEQTILGTLRQHLLRNAYDPQNGLPMVDFRQRIRTGARWSSLVYADTTVRKFLVDTYSHALMLALRAAGRDAARVFTEGDWVTFSITGETPGLPTLEQIEHLIHPNLQQMLEPA